MRRIRRSPEEEEAGLILIGRIYQSTNTPDAELYVHVLTDKGLVAYYFKAPETFWDKNLRWCTKSAPLPQDNGDTGLMP